MKKNNKKGFTLAELLIVVAIIAVLVAIAIPIFTAQLERSREATDAANIRSAYAEVMTNAVSGASSSQLKKSVTLRQHEDGWQNTFEFPSNLKAGSTEPAQSNKATVTFSTGNNTCSADIKLK